MFFLLNSFSQRLGNFLESFSSRIAGLAGTDLALAKVARPGVRRALVASVGDNLCDCPR